ncbi:MAG: amino acid permease [Elusimicrobia bacterium]|nr:amino acid permease [Elusimicrobiota bacterium]
MEKTLSSSVPAGTPNLRGPLDRLWRRKSLDQLAGDAERAQGLSRSLGPVELVALGIGAIIGAGIFLTVGTAAAGQTDAAGAVVRYGAGPAIIVSFLVTAVVCGFAALCYAEMASMIPISGSAYTYAYATMGELAAWIIGWDLLIEYAAGNVAVAISWSGYFNAMLHNLGMLVGSAVGSPDWNWGIPAWLAVCPKGAPPEVLAAAPRLFGVPIVFNLFAVLVVLALTWLLVVGVKESSRFNTIMVSVKLAILLFFVYIGLRFFDVRNWVPAGSASTWQGFAPNGWRGILSGASIVFFAYIGFDAVSTASEEAKSPKRDIPIGILGSLVVCTLVYVAVAAVLTGMVPFQTLNNAEPLTSAIEAHAGQLGGGWLRASAFLVALGSVVAHTAVLLVFQMGQPRIFFSMSRDGLLPAWCAKIHPKYRTPVVTTVLTGVVVAAFAGFFPIDEIVDLTNIGTLFAFALVCAGVLILRVTDPGRERPFKTPLVWLCAPLGILCCLVLMLFLPRITWVRFLVWLLIGLAFYLTMVVWNDNLQRAGAPPAAARRRAGLAGGVSALAITLGSVWLGLWR